MIRRLINPTKSQSFFLFGARGVGKSTLLKEYYSSSPRTLWIDLLTDQDELRFGRHPDHLSEILSLGQYDLVIIDEVQKAPKLLDIVHKEIENRSARFVLTGSSARKLKRGHANLLAGRAITYSLHPFTHIELQDRFSLQTALEWGTLPKVVELGSDLEECALFLKTYVNTYLREEILIEQLIRKTAPFRDFLPIAAQMNGEILNYSKIAKDIGVDEKTIKTYYEILEDTLLGFRLPPFHRSIRKRQHQSSKFYFFDIGVKRALESSLKIPLKPKTSAFGKHFEHWIVLECFRLNDYFQKDYRFSYLRTKDDAEIDLIIERPGQPDLLVEIKSTDFVERDQVQALIRFQKSWDRACLCQVWSLERESKKIDEIHCLHWLQGLSEIFQS
jgi:predicted AAA+ superfamily ATPase